MGKYETRYCIKNMNTKDTMIVYYADKIIKWEVRMKFQNNLNLMMNYKGQKNVCNDILTRITMLKILKFRSRSIFS